jgi:hypothetical protein
MTRGTRRNVSLTAKRAECSGSFWAGHAADVVPPDYMLFPVDSYSVSQSPL